MRSGGRTLRATNWHLLGAGATLLWLVFPRVAQAQAPGPASAGGYVPDFAQIATYVFVMLGPVKILGPFATTTDSMPDADRRRLALTGTLIALITLLAAATLGVSTLGKWRISEGALQLAGGVIIFLAALKLILAQFSPSVDVQASVTPLPMRQILRGLIFPTIVTPQGLALIILIVAAYPALKAQVALAVGGIMVLNLAVMLLARLILKAPGIGFALMIFGNVLGVLQVALGVQFIIGALRVIGVLPLLH